MSQLILSKILLWGQVIVIAATLLSIYYASEMQGIRDELSLSFSMYRNF